MNRSEAKEALKQGYILTHRLFFRNEFIYELKDKELCDESENILDASIFWKIRDEDEFDKDWSIIDDRNLTTEQELKLWSRTLKALEAIPGSMRSQYHTQYYNELERRISETQELINLATN